MLFTEFTFLLFLVAVTAVYFICPVKYRWIVLLVASIAFYAIAGVVFLPFAILTAALSFYTAKLIHKENQNCEEKLKQLKGDKEAAKACREKSKAKCRRYMAAALVLIFMYLAYTKFGRRVVDWFSVAVGKEWIASVIPVIVPLGISYYSFSVVGYVLDVYWKRYAPEQNFFKYLLYVLYFPHILQGPIARYNKLGVQFSQEHRFDYKRVCFGIQLIMWGFFQKLVIADRLNLFVSRAFELCRWRYGPILLLAAVFYAFQLYADFAGCVNMSRGMSQIFGIELEDNFRQPYFARSVDEFWRRWHITLGAWFKDYLYLPVSMSKGVKNVSKSIKKRFGATAGKNFITIVALAAVWLCTGVWHGTGWNYIIWGAWQFSLIVSSLLLEPVYVKVKKALRINDESIEWKTFQILRTFVLVGLIPRIIVRCASLSDAKVFFYNMIVLWGKMKWGRGTLFDMGLDVTHFVIAIVGIVIMIVVSVLKERGVSIRESISRMHIVVRWTIYIVVFYSIVIFGIYGPGYDASAFAYIGF